jgi:ribosomal protein S7
MKAIVSASAIALSLIASAASAQAVRTEKNMSLDLANQIAAATVASCSAPGTT